MSDPTNELFSVLQELQKRYPHWRFGQLVANVAAWAGMDKPGTIWEVSDKGLLEAAIAHLRHLDQQTSEQTPQASARA